MMGLEPTTYGLWAHRATAALHRMANIETVFKTQNKFVYHGYTTIESIES